MSSPRRDAPRARVLALVALALACDGVDRVDVDVSGKATIEARTVLGYFLGLVPFEGFDTVDVEQELRNQGVAEEDVDSVVVRSFTLTLESPAGQTFDFLDRITFHASADGLDEVRIASADAIDADARVVVLAVDDVELKPYATAERMRVRAEVQGERPDEATTIRADLVLDVDVTIPGCE